jgi:hypothetical protein
LAQSHHATNTIMVYFTITIFLHLYISHIVHLCLARMEPAKMCMHGNFGQPCLSIFLPLQDLPPT